MLPSTRRLLAAMMTALHNVTQALELLDERVSMLEAQRDEHTRVFHMKHGEGETWTKS
jgi:hypothetical protein